MGVCARARNDVCLHGMLLAPSFCRFVCVHVCVCMRMCGACSERVSTSQLCREWVVLTRIHTPCLFLILIYAQIFRFSLSRSPFLPPSFSLSPPLCFSLFLLLSHSLPLFLSSSRFVEMIAPSHTCSHSFTHLPALSRSLSFTHKLAGPHKHTYSLSRARALSLVSSFSLPPSFSRSHSLSLFLSLILSLSPSLSLSLSRERESERAKHRSHSLAFIRPCILERLRETKRARDRGREEGRVCERETKYVGIYHNQKESIRPRILERLTHTHTHVYDPILSSSLTLNLCRVAVIKKGTFLSHAV